MIDRSSLGHRAPLLWLVLPFATGLAAAHARALPAPVGLLAVAAVTAFVMAGILTRHAPTGWAMAFVIGGITTGMIYHDLRRDRLPAWHALPAREATLSVRIDRTFVSPAHYTSVSFLGHVLSAPAHLTDLEGQSLYLRVRGEPARGELMRSSVVEVIGHLTPLPRRAESRDGFDAYLTDAGLNFSLIRGRITRIIAPPTPFAQLREQVKQRGSDSLSRGLEAYPNLVGALRAMLLGERQFLTTEDKALFVRTGTMHLFAISGLHIGIIAAALFGGLRAIRLPPLCTFIATTILLAFYVDMIGRPPSAVRAWLMVTCVHAAAQFRAPRNPIAAIAGSAGLVLIVDPMQLFSAGFQMSYGIVFALLFYGLPLGEFLQHRLRLWRDLPEGTLTPGQKYVRRRWQQILGVSALAWSATTIGLISGVAFFGWFTPIAFLANLILIPIAGLAIIGGFIALIFGWLGVLPLAVLFNHAAALVLLVIQRGLALTGSGTWLSHPAEFRWGPWGAIGLLLVLGTMMVGYVHRWETKVGGWWGPPLVSFLVLVIGTRLG